MNKRIFSILIFCFFAEGLLARDFSSSVVTLNTQLKNIIMVLGPLAVLFTGMLFYFSRQLGLNYLMSAIIGTAIAAASTTIFSFFFNAFR